MDPKAPATRVIPSTALLHFAFSQREYAAVHAAVAYFAKKLRDPREKELAEQALARLMSPIGWSLPSEASTDEAKVDVQTGPKVVLAPEQIVSGAVEISKQTNSAVPKGLGALQEKKK